jgi:hypothetical protein
MTYSLRPTATGDTLASSRDPIRTNFQIIRDDFAIDHEGYNVSSDEGKHKQSTYLERDGSASKPVPTTLANECALYCKEQDSITTLFFRKESNGTEIQLTGVDPSAAGNGYTFLPGGLILQWGVKASPGQTGTITFSTSNIAFPNNCFNVSITQRRDSSSSAQGMYLNGAPTKEKFDYNGSSSGGDDALYWIAIGN